MMNKKKLAKRPLMIGVLLFQMLPISLIILFVSQRQQDASGPGWMENEQQSCKVFTNNNHLKRQFNWTGDCRAAYANGYGELEIFENGRKLFHYDGFMVNGKAQGKGSLFFYFDGDLYEGEFLNSKFHGYGQFFNDDGDHYEGDYQEGLKSGYGTYWYAPESKYLKYEGEWKEDEEHGSGTLYYRNGKKVKGIFESGKLLHETQTAPFNTDEYPKNILITNDDGMEDLPRLQCLAEAFSSFADKIVIAVSKQNRSGTSNVTSLTKLGYVDVRTVSIDSTRQIYIYEVDAYPGDCVLFGALGIFGQMGESVDLVVSGINGGGNIGVEWFGSGTIGAARTAALAHIPTIAVSGIDEDQNEQNNLPRICEWVSSLIQSPLLSSLAPLEYLTVSIPENINELKGIKVLERAITYDQAPFQLVKIPTNTSTPQDKSRWQLKMVNSTDVYDLKASNDVALYYQNNIVIVPMSVDENARNRLPVFQAMEKRIPGFPE